MGNVSANRSRPPMKIHNLSGKNLKVSNDRLKATRHEGYADAMFFGSRTVDRDENIELVITRMTQDWNGSLRFGFTSHDPVAICNHPEGIPRFMCPDLIKRGGSFIETLNHIKLRVGDKIVFWVTSGGEIKFKVNEVIQRQQVTKLITRDVWPVVDVYGNAVEVTFRSLKDKEVAVDVVEPHFYNSLRLTKFPLTCNPDSVDIINRDIVRRRTLQKAFAWNNIALQVNNVWVLFVKEVDYLVSNNLNIVVLTNPPDGFSGSLPRTIVDFPRSSVFNNVYTRMFTGDELAVCITDAGHFMAAINGDAFQSLGTVPKSANYWIVADLNCDILSLHSVGVFQMTKFALPKMPSVTGEFASRLSTMTSSHSFDPVSEISRPDAVRVEVEVRPPNKDVECVICLNNVPDCVFVPCGHICCCMACAENLMNEHGNLFCPTCRNKIEKCIEIHF